MRVQDFLQKKYKVAGILFFFMFAQYLYLEYMGRLAMLSKFTNKSAIKNLKYQGIMRQRTMPNSKH